MSNTPNDTNTDLSLEPPMIVGTGGYSLAPGQQLAPRVVTGVSKQFGNVSQTDILGGTVTGNQFQYVGQGLVNSKGILDRQQYTSDEAYSELARLSAADRRAFLNALHASGVYGSSRPSQTGFSTQDISAVKEAMLYANWKGVTLDVAASMMLADPDIKQNMVSASTVRTTPKQDLKAVFKQVSSNVLGRALSDAEAERFAKAYQRQEMAQGMGGSLAPNVQVAAEEQIQATNPDEVAAVGALKLTNVIDSAIKELG